MASAQLSQAASARPLTDAEEECRPQLLGVKANKLKADDEMRRIFGSRVVDAEARGTQAAGMAGGSRRVRRYCPTRSQPP